MNPTNTPTLDESTFDQPFAAWLPPLTRLLDEQSALCDRLAALGAAQATHVEAERTEALIGVLGERQNVLDRIVELNAALAPFRARRHDALRTLPAHQRQSLQSRIDHIADTVDRVRLGDETDRIRLETRRKGVADELAGLSRLRGAAAAYASVGSAAAPGSIHPTHPSGSSSPKFHDRHG